MSTWSPKDDQSTKSWGTPYVSPSVTSWGTLSTTTTTSSDSSSCWQNVTDHNTAWSPPNNIVVGSPQASQGWTSNASSPLYPSLGNSPVSPSAASSSYGGYSSPPVSSSAGSWTQLQLNPLLDSRSPQCLKFDIGALQYMPNMNGPAWPVNIQVHDSVTVSQVVRHLFEFLQGYQNAHDLQKSKVQIPSGYNHSPSLRDQNHPNGFHSGKRRIDLLGRHRIFRGLSPDTGPNCAWVVHLSDR